MMRILLVLSIAMFLGRCGIDISKDGANKDGEKKMLGGDIRLFENTPVWEVAQAIVEDDTIRIKEFLKGKPDSIINYQEKRFGQSLLEWAVDYDYYPAAKVLAELGVDPNLQSYNGTSAFIHAAGKPDSKYLKLLLKYGGDVNAVAKTSEPQRLRTPLMAAAATSVENVKLLIEAGANPNYVHSLNGNSQSALLYALRSDNIDIINYLIMEVGVDYKRVLNVTINGDGLYVTDFLRNLPYPLDSEEYQKKMKLVNFLQERGMNYWEASIPKHYYNIYDSVYLEKY